MTTLETSLTRLITKDPTILNENANKVIHSQQCEI